MRMTILLALALTSCSSESYYNASNQATPSGIAAYRSALTLDWLQAEDSRQRELVATYERDPGLSPRVSAECVSYAKPTPGKVARLMLELLRNLEGDDGTIIPELVQQLVRNKLLMETSMLDAEPDLEALVETPQAMVGEPHATFPRILSVVWLLVTDPASTKVEGWCPIQKINKFMSATKPAAIAKQMRELDPIVARVRFIMEEFILNVTPINFQNSNMSKLSDNYHKSSKDTEKKLYFPARTPPVRRYLNPNRRKAVDLNAITTTITTTTTKIHLVKDQVELLNLEEAEKKIDIAEKSPASVSKPIGQIVFVIVVLEYLLK